MAAMAKSVLKPNVAPPAFDTDIVHTTVVPKRDGLVLRHARLDAAVGVPYAINVGAPFVIETPPTCAIIAYTLVVASAVVENVNVCPPLAVDNALVGFVAEIVKSVARPVVAPPAPDTLIVQTMAVPTRQGLVLVHEKPDATVGVP